jgi:SAM-dependent methyltransferase
MSNTREQTEVYFSRRIETLVDPRRHRNCSVSHETIMRFVKFHNFDAPPGKHLDIGCGDRVLSKVFNENGWSSTGIDIADGIDFESDKLPFDDFSVDMITLYGVIEHIANPDILLKEIHRILRSKGVCIMITPNIISEGMTFYNDPDHKKPYSPKGFAWLMKMYGFDFCEVGLWTVKKPSFIWGLPQWAQFFLGKLFPFHGSFRYAPQFLKGRSKTMIGLISK